MAIEPLFSISVSPPVRSRMAVAEPSVPAAVALIAPLLRMTGTAAPASIRIAVVFALAALPPAAAIVPLLRISATLAPLPSVSAVALAPFELAWTEPAMPMPLAIVTAPPRPPVPPSPAPVPPSRAWRPVPGPGWRRRVRQLGRIPHRAHGPDLSSRMFPACVRRPASPPSAIDVTSLS